MYLDAVGAVELSIALLGESATSEKRSRHDNKRLIWRPAGEAHFLERYCIDRADLQLFAAARKAYNGCELLAMVICL